MPSTMASATGTNQPRSGSGAPSSHIVVDRVSGSAKSVTRSNDARPASPASNSVLRAVTNESNPGPSTVRSASISGRRTVACSGGSSVWTLMNCGGTSSPARRQSEPKSDESRNTSTASSYLVTNHECSDSCQKIGRSRRIREYSG